ncbi:MAG: FadR/GntR family transcriptional regulator [Paludibacteraceae bacterium]
MDNIVVEEESMRPDEMIIRSIRDDLQSGVLQPGMRLPAERKMAERFGVGRIHVREALSKLETYGIIRTRPQSGSVIVGLDISAIDGLLTDVLRLHKPDFAALAEMRVLLEVNSARFCAERHTAEEMQEIEEALENYKQAYDRQQPNEINATDFQLHRCIARGAHNSVLNSMMLIITPEITDIFHSENVCDTLDKTAYLQHCELVRLIRERRSSDAAELMQQHLSGMLNYAQKLRK